MISKLHIVDKVEQLKECEKLIEENQIAFAKLLNERAQLLKEIQEYHLGPVIYGGQKLHPHELKIYNSKLYDDGIFRVTMDFMLPHYKRTKANKTDLYLAMSTTYASTLVQEIMKHNIPMIDEKAFVLIVQYFPNHIERDLDNRFHSFIFNAFRACGVIKNDSFENLCYMDEGRYEKGMKRTEVLIGKYSQMEEIIKRSHEPLLDDLWYNF